MLSVRALTNADQAATYFEHDDYYVAGAQVAPSSWWGEGAMRLGLRGAVERDPFADLLHGRLPNGETLDRGRAGKHQPGVDATFSAPKSVSLVALVGGDQRVLAAHDRAVTAALEYLEQTAARTRSKREGAVRIERSDNLVVARFNHDSSRELDPQLHTHAVILNVTQRDDGSWRATFNRELFRAQKAATAVYRAELARRLRHLGYQIDRTHADGRFEVRGISRETIDVFSQRRAQIVEHLERLGLEGPKAAEVAARATREAKRDVRRDVLTAEWRNRAAEIGLDFGRLRSKMHRSSPGRDRIAADEALDHAIQHVAERSVIASERQLIHLALGFGVGTVRLPDLVASRDRKLAGGEIIPAISTNQKDEYTRHFTTDRAVATEQNLVNLVRRGRDRVEPIVKPEHLARVLADIERQSAVQLTSGQTAAIRLVLSTRDQLVGIQGYAGTGKTTGALLHIRRAAGSAGFEVHGFAPSAVAAELLAKEAGIESMTIAKHLLARPRPSERPQLWIVDEASMLGNEAARDLLISAREGRARIVFVGDRDQLPSIEAGRAFGMLADHGLSIATIDTIVRQKDPELRQAVVKTIAREHESAVELLRPRIVSIRERRERLRAIANAFLDLDRRTSLVITPSNADRRPLNELIRRGLQERGLVGVREIDGPILVRHDLTKAEAKDAVHYVPGDVVRFGRAYKRLGVDAKSYLTVKAVDVASGIVTLERDEKEIAWNPSRMTKVEVYRTERRAIAPGDLLRWTRNDESNGRYNAGLAEVLSIDRVTNSATILVNGDAQTLDLARERHWEHAYASTIHAAQGRTADRVLLHLDSTQSHLLGHESWYVGISRARRDVRIFTDDAELLPGYLRASLQQESALEVAQRATSFKPPPAELEERPPVRAHRTFEIGR